VHQLDIKVLNVIDARCNHKVYTYGRYQIMHCINTDLNSSDLSLTEVEDLKYDYRRWSCDTAGKLRSLLCFDV